MLDLLPGLVALFDLDMRYVYANATYARWRGLPPREVVGRHCREIVGDDNFPKIEAKLREAMGGRHISFEYDLFDDDYRRRVQGNYVPYRGADGSIVGVLALVTDISRREDLQQRIAQSEATFDQAFRNSPIGMAVVDPKGGLLRVNPALATMLGRDEAELRGIGFDNITHPDDIDADLSLFAEAVSGERNGYQLDKRYIHSNGNIVEAQLTVTVTRDAAGAPTHFVAQVEDVTEERAAERRLRRDAARLDLAIGTIRGGFWHMDVQDGRFVTSEQLGGFVRGEASALSLAEYLEHIHPEDRGGADLSQLIAGEIENAPAEYRLHTPTGDRWMRCERRLTRDADGLPEQLVGVVLDITEERERQLSTQAEAETDALTGLCNRRGLLRRLEAADPAASVGVIAIDLDRFKQVNDTHGHAIGDVVLMQAAQRLRDALRHNDIIARTGGDEFLVVLQGVERAALQAAAQRIATALNRGFKHGSSVLPVGASVGAGWVASGEELPKLIDRADDALYAVKRNGRGNWQVAA